MTSVYFARVGVREYPGNFQNETVISKLFFEGSVQVKWEGRPFWSGRESSIYPLNYLLPTYRGNVINYYRTKCSSAYSYSACGNKEHPSNFQYKSVNSPFNWVSRYILFLPKLKGKERYFRKGAKMKRRGTTLQDYNLVDIRHEKVSLFVKFEIILLLLCFLLEPLTNKHCGTWSSMINFSIDSRTCQK